MQETPRFDDSPTDGGPHSSAHALVRLLSRRYLLVLVAVAVLVIVDQAIIQPSLMRLNIYAPAINVAGRQRMLSQKVTKASLALAAQVGEAQHAARRAELSEALRQWTAAHRGLLAGDPQLGLEPIEEPRTVAALRALEPSLDAIRRAAEQLARGDAIEPAAADASSAGAAAQEDTASQEGTAADHAISAGHHAEGDTAAAGDITQSKPPATMADDTADATAACLASILDEETRFLRGMEQVVAMLEASSRRQVAFLRSCGLAVMVIVLGLLVAVYFFVLDPATRLIRQQIGELAERESRHRLLAHMLAEARDELESRVAARTAELSTANAALERKIAERQAAVSRMRELSGQLAHASRVTALGQLATGLAHEINQPLATVTNYADTAELLLEREPVDVEQLRRVAAESKQAALRAGAIVRRMRQFVRRGTGPSSRVEVSDLVREVSELCRPQLDEASVQLRLETATQPTTVEADALEIQQVLVNLVQNAVQALADCPRARRCVRLRTHVDAGDVYVEVADTGPGFSGPGAQEAFAPFFTTKPDGLGMGLAISRTILERYQGRLWGRNRPEGGALVGFSLPLATAHDAQRSNHADCICR